MLTLDNEFYNENVNFIVGCDEAGRGPLCGPVVAAAVILKKGYINEEINDSKKLTEKKREKLFIEIINNCVAFSLTYISSKEIDEINILEASRKAMKNSILKLKHNYDLVITDAMKIDGLNVDVIPIIKGDAKSQTIAAASIIAKVCRDRYMKCIAKKYPEYHLDKNKGYGTKEHLEAIEKYGPIENFHRFSYAPIKK